ncbi:MAG: RagB/SusD family nutrient uptake outer membrane protein [Lutibacter sp.]|jgi:tetratricopeptide (TPR) repeat protein
MKKYNYIKFLLLCLSFVFTNCTNDFLEVEPKGAPTAETFWKTEVDINRATNALYLMNDAPAIYGRGMFLYSLIPSDDFVVGKSKSEIEEIKNFVTSGSGSYTRDIWSIHFQVIKRANDIINNVPGIEGVSNEVKNFSLGNAYFMRGLAYFQLSLLYGDNRAGIPIVDENTTDFYMERSPSVTDSYEYAAENFSKAAELLPLFSELSSSDYGKAHKNAAYAYLAKTHLHNAEFDHNSWQKVIDACNKVTSTQNELESNFEDVFKIANNWGKEYIWSVPSNVIGGSIFPGVSLENKGWGLYNGWGYFAPTLDLYESYVAGDKRRDATLLAFGDEFEYFGQNRRYWSTMNLTGIQLKKYMEPYSYPNGVHLNGNGDQPSTDLNPPLLRLATVYLMRAEAKIALGQDGDADLNKVRVRAGLAPISGATLDDVKYERRAEFAGELFGRFEDLCRWGDIADIKKALSGRRHDNKADPDSGFSIYEVWKPRNNFDLVKNRVWPIPPNVIDDSRGFIKQNER